jgi:ABC-2 type transport system permease protein
MGIIHKLLVSPAYRFALVFGKALSAGGRGLALSIAIYLLVAAIGVDLRLDPISLLGTMAAVLLGCAIFATLSLIVACFVKTRERFMGVGQLLTMPLFFASNAIYPIDVMPNWLRLLSRVNPVTYLVDALRGLMIHGGHSAFGVGFDFLVLTAILAALLAISAKLYPTIIR